jgi:hypothetical protein
VVIITIIIIYLQENLGLHIALMPEQVVEDTSAAEDLNSPTTDY